MPELTFQWEELEKLRKEQRRDVFIQEELRIDEVIEHEIKDTKEISEDVVDRGVVIIQF